MTTHHVIIGAGPAATNAIETIRQLEAEPSRITLLCNEPAHSRMALPYWLAGTIPREQTMTADDAFFQRLNVEARIGVHVERIQSENQSVTLADGSTIEFDTLLIATGASPTVPPIEGVDLPGVQPMWSLDHMQAALNVAAEVSQPRVVLVGAGFVGMIVLSAMFKRDWPLTIVEREGYILPHMLDAEAAGIVSAWLRARNVTVHTGVTVQAILAAGNEKKVQLNDAATLPADLVVLSTGVRGNVSVATGTNVAVDEGILVDDRMQTNIPNIYAAGDAAQGPVLDSDRRAIHAIHPTAVDHGRVAGANMAGVEVPYPGSLSMNVLDVCGLQCASYGRFNDPDAEAVTISHPECSVYRKLLWQGDQLVGALLTGRPSDAGMLTDMGMIRGILQTRVPMGVWKQYLMENPFDVRRAFVALKVAAKLAQFTLLGTPSRARGYRYQDRQPATSSNPHHALYVNRGS